MQNSLFNPQISPVTSSAHETYQERNASPDIDANKARPFDLTTVEHMIDRLTTQSERACQSF